MRPSWSITYRTVSAISPRSCTSCCDQPRASAQPLYRVGVWPFALLKKAYDGSNGLRVLLRGAMRTLSHALNSVTPAIQFLLNNGAEYIGSLLRSP